MPMYGLPSGIPMNNQYQNPSMMNPNPMMQMPILGPHINVNSNQSLGVHPYPVDANGNFYNYNNQNPMMPNTYNPQGYPKFPSNNNNNNPKVQQQNPNNYPNNNANNNANVQPQHNQQQVDSNYPDFFN